MFSNKKDERFKVIYKQGGLSACQVLQDTETGVNYLFTNDGYAGGLTVLFDRDGKPVVTPIEK